jgi:aryl-alcohol dehydrogenase-like predicted oxidoreductase
MRYVPFGKNGIQISVVGIGTWVTGGDNWGRVDDVESVRALSAALDKGINVIDTAPSYGDGHAETIVGSVLKKRREKVFVATKCGLRKKGKRFELSLKPEAIRSDVEGSLKRLNIETIDLYQCHWPDPETPIEETMEALLSLREQGKIRWIGVSNFPVELMETTILQAPVISLQAQYSLLERGLEAELLPFCRDHAIGVLTYGSLAGGILTGKYETPPALKKGDPRSFFYRYYRGTSWDQVGPLVTELRNISNEIGIPAAQVALRWVLYQPGVTCTLVGIRSVEQAIVNAGTADMQLSPDHRNRLDAAANAVAK